MSEAPTKILIVDDSALYRQSILNVLREIPCAEVVGTAKDGVEAITKVADLDPDLLTLDVQMPDKNGIEVLQEVKALRLRAKAIMVSSLTSEGAQVTTDALMEGAFDFILKPMGPSSAENRKELRDALEEKILAFREGARSRRARRAGRAASLPETSDQLGQAVAIPTAACDAVILGASTGGPQALKTILPRLTADLDVPILVVQHMPPQYTASLAGRLNEACRLEVVEARDNETATAGKVFLAPGGRQMKLTRHGTNLLLRVRDDPPENAVRPSIDYLLRSACTELSGNALAIILTGMGRDGLSGCKQLKEDGGVVFAQHQDDCIVYGMPKAVIDAELADRVLPLGKIAPAIARHLRRSRRA